jgi:hypothetical protein
MRHALLVSLLLFVLPAAPAEANRHHCNPPGAKSVTRDERGRVYRVASDNYRDKGYDRYYTCLYRTGRTRWLGSDLLFPDDVGRVRIASPYVAWAEDQSNSEAQGQVLHRMDMWSGRRTDLDGFFSGESEPGQTATLRRFLVTRFGAVVWARYEQDYSTVTGEIRKIDENGRQTLDTGADIPAHTLHLSRSGHRAFWQNDGRQKSARLR